MSEQKLLTIGIDVGTTTTHVVFSEIVLVNISPSFQSARIKIKKKEVLHQSVPHFTPFCPIGKGYRENHRFGEVDGARLAALVEDEFQKAGSRGYITPANVDTGAVIITGEAHRKHNAEKIINTLSDFAGDFVVAAAGPDLESILAGRGSGACEYSMKNGTEAVLNIDIGGGTSNFVVFKDGKVEGTSCVSVGGRLIEFEQGSFEITNIAPSGRAIMDFLKISKNIGDELSLKDVMSISGVVIDILDSIVFPSETDTSIMGLKDELTDSRCSFPEVQTPVVFFSGGVAASFYTDVERLAEDDVGQNCLDSIFERRFEMITKRWITRYGDIGPLLGRLIKQSKIAQRFDVLTPRHTIGATVMGAATQLMNLSGSTIFYDDINFHNCTPNHKLQGGRSDEEYRCSNSISSVGLSPIKNVPIIKPFSTHLSFELGDQENSLSKSDWIAQEILRAIKRSGQNIFDQYFALAIPKLDAPNAKAIEQLAKGICTGLARASADLHHSGKALSEFPHPIIVICESDIAKALGQYMRRYLKLASLGRSDGGLGSTPIICLDQISVTDGDYIDIGTPLCNGKTVPVMIKTLVFC